MAKKHNNISFLGLFILINIDNNSLGANRVKLVVVDVVVKDDLILTLRLLSIIMYLG